MIVSMITIGRKVEMLYVVQKSKKNNTFPFTPSTIVLETTATLTRFLKFNGIQYHYKYTLKKSLFTFLLQHFLVKHASTIFIYNLCIKYIYIKKMY